MKEKISFDMSKIKVSSSGTKSTCFSCLIKKICWFRRPHVDKREDLKNSRENTFWGEVLPRGRVREV